MQGGRIEVSIRENPQNGENVERLTYSVTIQRSCFDGKEKKWKRAKSLFPADLLAAAEALRMAWVTIAQAQQRK